MKKLVLLTVLCFAALSAGAQSPELFLQMGHSGTINAVAYSPNGRRIAAGSSNNTIKI